MAKKFWTLELCKKHALKYTYKGEWRKLHSPSFFAAFKNNWMKECCKHMISKHVLQSFWTFDKCKEEALKYTYKSDWLQKNSGSYQAAIKNDWVEECSKHMIPKIIIYKHWNLEKCKEEALKYKTRNEFQKKSPGLYRTCLKNKWMDLCFERN